MHAALAWNPLATSKLATEYAGASAFVDHLSVNVAVLQHFRYRQILHSYFTNSVLIWLCLEHKKNILFVFTYMEALIYSYMNCRCSLAVTL
jgi:hypothetical protein